MFIGLVTDDKLNLIPNPTLTPQDPSIKQIRCEFTQKMLGKTTERSWETKDKACLKECVNSIHGPAKLCCMWLETKCLPMAGICYFTSVKCGHVGMYVILLLICNITQKSYHRQEHTLTILLLTLEMHYRI